MQQAKRILDRFPGLKSTLKRQFDAFQGIPPLDSAGISDEIIRACVAKPDPVILEIGCNDGGQSIWLSEMFANATIYCFEPEPRAIARFKANVGERPNIHLFELALSDCVGEIEFYQSSGQHAESMYNDDMPEGWDHSGSIRKPKGHLAEYPWVKFEQITKVKTTTLDAWRAENRIETIDFIWMDVQGAEMDVFRGGMTSLSRTRFLYTEYSNCELYEGQGNLKQILAQLRDFKALARYPNDVLLQNSRLRS